MATFLKAVHEHVHVNVHDYVDNFARRVADCKGLKLIADDVVVIVDVRRGR